MKNLEMENFDEKFKHTLNTIYAHEDSLKLININQDDFSENKEIHFDRVIN